MAFPLTFASLEKVFNHIVLPPQLPAGQDDKLDEIAVDIKHCIRRACDALKSTTPDEFRGAWTAVENCISTFSSTDGEHRTVASLLEAFQRLTQDDKVITFYIEEQNAALLMYSSKGHVVFEAFEAAPPSQDVLACQDALKWTFPSRAVQISKDDFADEQFQSTLALFLDKASSEYIALFAAKAKKAGKEVAEFRNAGTPDLITHMLLSVLQAMGGPAAVSPIKKRVRDDVSFGKGHTPWRRLPTWLILRVAMQRQLHLTLGQDTGYAAYKILSCTLLSQLLDDCVHQGMLPALTSLLQKKLGRKLAKLERHHFWECCTEHDKMTSEALIHSIASKLRTSLDVAQQHLQKRLSQFKEATMRKIPALPLQAPDDHRTLSLPSSRRCLDSLVVSTGNQVDGNSNATPFSEDGSLHSNLTLNPAVKNTQAFSRSVLDTLNIIADARSKSSSLWSQAVAKMTEGAAEAACDQISATVSVLVNCISKADLSTVEMRSRILLEIFDQWAILDTICGSLYPTVDDHPPVFPHNLLDVLQLPDVDSMSRLRRVQKHLRHRFQIARYDETVLSNEFGSRFAYESEDLTHLYDRIKQAENVRRQNKTKEWEEACNKYDLLSNSIGSLTCNCTMKDGVWVRNGCKKCPQRTKRKKMKIEPFEDLLPENKTAALAVVFELKTPQCITIYRATTWKIAAHVACSQPPTISKDAKGLPDTLIHKFATSSPSGTISLSSSQKSFKQTHYKQVKMKCKLTDVLLPLGSNFRLFDNAMSVWIHDLQTPLTLAHVCPLHVPSGLGTKAMSTSTPTPTCPQGPSSYEIVASRRKCPSDISVHEFEALQRLQSGTSRRWPTMAVELGCSNLNFGKEDVSMLFVGLAHQAGPLLPASGDLTTAPVSHKDALGVVHGFFLDDNFRNCVLCEIEKRLSTIANNWREVTMMEMLVTLLLRIRALTECQVSNLEKVDSLLACIRKTTLGWMDSLRGEAMNAHDGNSSERASMYAFKAALVCRCTFVCFKPTHLSADDLFDFIRASITLQQSLTIDIRRLPLYEHGLATRDTVMADTLQVEIEYAAKRFPESINKAIHHCIGSGSTFDAQGQVHPTRLKAWSFHSGHSKGWISSAMVFPHAKPPSGNTSQLIALHLTHGHLLVNGQTIGKLPDDIRDSDDVRDVLGNKHLLTYPSAMPGMSHRLVTAYEDHMIHFGRRSSGVVILAIKRSGELFEYVPRRVFIDRSNVYDLPRGLVDDCFHWLNRRTGKLEIRRRETKWETKRSDWVLDVGLRNAVRGNDELVDPRSETASLAGLIFDGFEDTQRLTIFQPANVQGPLSMELRHLELSFFVNAKGNLECRELGAEVDVDQDAGTLYGYHSMIVLRETADPTQRSIIAPLGDLKWERSGVHICLQTAIDLTAVSSGSGGPGRSNRGKAYARFEIDTVLGRLTCAPEPRLLFTKAQLHAFTSYPLPDPLTGRTGEDEAIHLLLSGRLQPWVPLPQVCLWILRQIRMLVPVREYYPKDKRVLQTAKWDENLPIGLQNDRYGRIVQAIVAKAARLRMFEETGDNKAIDEAYRYWSDINTSHLQTRGEIQRMRFECPREDSEPACPVQLVDGVYTSLGHVDCLNDKAQDACHCRASAAFQIAKIVRDKPSNVFMTRGISDLLETWTQFGGFSTTMDPDVVSISSLLSSAVMTERWGSLVEMCRRASSTDGPKIMLTLACMALAPDVDMNGLRLLAAYSYQAELKPYKPPLRPSYRDFVYNEDLTYMKLISIVQTEFEEYVATDIQATGRRAVELAIDMGRNQHTNLCHHHSSLLATELMKQWPGAVCPNAGAFESQYIKVAAAMEKIRLLWQNLQQNRELSRYIMKAQLALSSTMARPRHLRSTEVVDVVTHVMPIPCAKQHPLPSLSNHLATRPFLPALPSTPEITTPRHGHPVRKKVAQYTTPKEYSELAKIIEPFQQSIEPMRQSYGQDLAASLATLERATRDAHTQGDTGKYGLPSVQEASQNLLVAKTCAKTALGMIQDTFCEAGYADASKVGQQSARDWLQRSGLWPRLTPMTILQLLRSNSKVQFGDRMDKALLRYGQILSECQRLRRILRALRKGDQRKLHDEMANPGHTNWSPEAYPDWLLLEIDSNMLIREEQVTVALAMISPESGSNAVVQLNMGKGKTSMILPMVLSVLADGTQLARLLAPKALLLPTAQVLQLRLGGLVGREIRHVPFSRRLLSRANCWGTLGLYRDLHRDLKHNKGVLIVAPEHVLAFTLCGQQCYMDGKNLDLATEMMTFDAEMRQSFCRDVLDESDFSLAVRTQLVYPSGNLTAIDGAPFRWKLVQALLSLLEGHALDLANKDPHRLNVIKRPGGGFPKVYILHSSIDEELRERLSADIMDGRVSFFRPTPPRDTATPTRSSGAYASNSEIRHRLGRAIARDSSDAAISKAAQLFSDTDTAAAALYLVRGLLQHDILSTCLKKRWNVHYGLHHNRWPIAVPYEARGVPSERSEFGHPDVAIVFTCLAFYYAGISLAQFRDGLNHVLHHVDDPATEYERWASGDGLVLLPDELQHWSSINVDDDGQVEKLWTWLRYTRSVINHYLNTFVFPVHSRQFSVKLQASAWDLPLFTVKASSSAKKRPDGARTTGFSGTNDNKAMLPLSIKQHDLPGLQQTNAEVMSYLLQLRNRSYICAGGQSKRWSEQELVASLVKYQIQIFIDAGAYIIEKTNENLARSWLCLAEATVKAAVYFDEKDNRAWVVFRDATAEKVPLVSTPFAERLDDCIVYFDEAHTRGVDLLLPPNARGALTLALGQTKDHTVQAAMRLRQLGTTQSVVFFAPPEVDQSIRDTCGLETSDKTDKKVFVNSSHVVAWLLEQTCKANEQLRPLYASHGLDFCRRMEALTMHKKTLRSASSRDSLLGVLEQPERQTLETMYGNDTVDTGSVLKTDGFSYPRLQCFAEQLRTYRSTTGHGTAALQGAFEEVEQEREVEVQVEQQRRAQHNIDFKALRFNGTVAKSICQFVETGELTGNNGYEGMFSFLASTSIGKRYGIVHGTPSRLFVTTEFRKTIDASRAGQQFHDDFLRPVEWLLWCPASQTGVVIIPEELELLIPCIRASKYTQLVAYAAPVTRSMLDFSSLRFYAFPELPKKRHTMPEWLPIELGILAGRLYMTYDEVTAMAKYLGLSANANEDCVRNTTSFCTNPTSFLLEWLALRRATQDVLHTPAAYVCQGRQLQPDHSFFLKFNKRLIHGEDEQGMNDDILEQQEQIMEDDEEEDMEEEDEHDEEGDGLLKIRLENLALLDGNMKVQAQDEQKRDGEKVPL